MSDPDKDFLPATDSSSIPGHVLTAPTAFIDWRLAKERAIANYIASTELAVSQNRQLSTASHKAIMDAVAQRIMEHQFDGPYGTGFRFWAFSAEGVNYLAYLSLSKKEPRGFTENQASDLVKDNPDAGRAVLAIWGLIRPLDLPVGSDAAQATPTPAMTSPADPTPSSDT